MKHFGPVGAGTRFKLILNALQAVHLEAFGEAVRMAEAAGLDADAVGRALVERPGGVVTQMAQATYPRIPERVSFPLRWAFKDLNYAAAMAEDDGVAHPLLDATRTAFALHRRRRPRRGRLDGRYRNRRRPPQVNLTL